jgi:hypothetical protein
MRDQREPVWIRLSLVGCVLSGIVLGACALGSASGGASTSHMPAASNTPHGTLVTSSALQTMHRDFIMWQWSSGNCATDTPPPDGAPPADEALLGQQTWGSGGKSGYECGTTIRSFMAGVFFAPEQLGTVEPAHATLQLHVDPPTQPNECVVQMEVASPTWESEDPLQSLATPYAIIPLGTTQGDQQSLRSVTIDRQTQTVTVDVTSAAQDWIAKQSSIDGLVFKTPSTCGLIHLTQIKLYLDHTVLSTP